MQIKHTERAAETDIPACRSRRASLTFGRSEGYPGIAPDAAAV